MLKENLIMLRNIHGFSQEEIAGKIGISRQAYAKWENGATVPDIEKCMRLAEVYGVTIDSLVKTTTLDGKAVLPPPPAGKNIYGSITINERGQLVIPKEVREKFGLTGGQRLIVLTDPAFAGGIADLSQYTDIVIGYPAWWYTCPMIVLRFLEQYDLTGKNVYLFNTHGGSGPVGTDDVKKLCSGTVHKSIDGNHLTQDTVREWLSL